MSVREIWEIELSTGKLPVSKWIGRHLSGREKTKLDVRFWNIESEPTVSKEWLRPYVSLKMVEIRFSPGGRAIRFLCHEQGNHLILLEATQKDGDIDIEVEKRAVKFRSFLLKEEIGVRRYPLPQRAP